ncbi:MAG: restriction endonuclease subunit S, partial [Fervidobacterium sp.]
MSCNKWRETELGLIPMDWDIKAIGEIGKVVGGGTPNTKEYKYWDGDISWITPKDLSGYNERYIYKGERSITMEGLENSSARLLPKGTVLFSSRAP